MESINESEIRDLLRAKLPAQELAGKILRRLMDPSLSWEEKRPFWHFLYNTGRNELLMEAMRQGFEIKQRVPFDLLIETCARANLQPSSSVLASLFKGLKKGRAHEDILSAKGWDKWDSRLSELRNELSEQKVVELRKHRENMVEKFHFLTNQRMTEQAGRVLRRLLELYPGDEEIQGFKATFDEAWARDVLSTHMSTLQAQADTLERTLTQPSSADQEMLKSFLSEGEKLALAQREFAFDLAVGFWFMDEYEFALEILNWAEPHPSADWMRAEVLFAARRFLEALEHLNQLEVKYINDPETTFAVSYLRAQCLYGLGQRASGMEIMQSIVRVRAQYRSAHALILKWTEGVSWE